MLNKMSINYLEVIFPQWKKYLEFRQRKGRENNLVERIMHDRR